MGYGDYTPSGGYHNKKPLSKAQLKKIKDGYKRADELKIKIREEEAGDVENAEEILSELL